METHIARSCRKRACACAKKHISKNDCYKPDENLRGQGRYGMTFNAYTLGIMLAEKWVFAQSDSKITTLILSDPD
jgi:hypothetical protein